jgi:glycosyltransferase involved in cell wall biosynthesis
MRIALLTTDSREHFREYNNPNPYFGTAPAALLEGFAQIPKLEIHVISCIQKPMSSPRKLSSNIWFHSLYVPNVGWLRTGYAGCILAVRRKLCEIRPDIVHAQGTERDCAISTAVTSFPKVLTIHGNIRSIAKTTDARPFSFWWFQAKLESFVFPMFDGVFCNSAFTQSLVNPRAKRTWLVPNPIRESFFAPLISNTLPVDTPTFLVVGVICPRKRQLELLQLLIQMRKHNVRFRVSFIGSLGKDAYGKAFLTLLNGQGNAGWAKWLGVLDESSLIRCMDESQALIHFPLEEAFGLVVAEALARGLKLFASNVGGICDIASGVPDVELFDSEDWDRLARALMAWIQKPILSSPQTTQRLMKSRYHPQVIANRHLEIYREVLSANNPS